MIQGIGLDIVELKRIESVYIRKNNFAKRILTDKEQLTFQSFSDHRKIEFLAGRFAAKEAYAKAIGSGIGKELSFQDIEVIASPNGKPYLYRKNNENGDYVCHLSITHTRDYAAAQVVIEGKD